MTKEHMPDPLRIASGDPTFITVPHVAKPINCGSQQLARRIVACVNACEGIDTEQLEPKILGDQIAAKMQLIDELAEMRELLRDFSNAFNNFGQPKQRSSLHEWNKVMKVCDENARAALAKLS